jgi:RNA polymerase sigma factor for flagellar operon FliA
MQASPAASKDCNAIVNDFAPMVARLARQMVSRLPASVEVDDMIQAGMIGLWDAARRYEDGHSATFETFASQRVRGAMLDELRQSDWAPRGVRRNRRAIDSAIHGLEQRLGRAPTEAEIAGELGMALPLYQRFVSESHGADFVAYDETDAADRIADPNPDPATRFEERRSATRLADAMECLPERERQILACYHEEEMTYREIAQKLGLTESRICQLHRQAVARLRSKVAS